MSSFTMASPGIVLRPVARPRARQSARRATLSIVASATPSIVVSATPSPAAGPGSIARRGLFLGTASASLLFAVPGGLLPAGAATEELPGAAALYGSPAQVAAVKKSAQAALAKAITGENAGALLRAAFHDAGTFDAVKATGGANGSLQYELDQPENGGLKYAFAVLKGAKANVKGDITWADFFQLGGAAAVAKTGGPKIPVQIGRPDASTKDPAGQLPGKDDTAGALKTLFQRNGFTTEDLVALSGAHTIGSSRKNDPRGAMEPTPAKFDNLYFRLLLKGDFGAFASDRALVTDPETKQYVEAFAKSQPAFFKAFSAAYLKMGLHGVAA